MKLNTNGSSNQQVTVNVGDSFIEKSEEEKLLGVMIDKRLSSLARISGYIDSNKLKILLRAFVISHFKYCPLGWMFHSRQFYTKINRIHEIALRIAYKGYDSSFNTLLEKDGSVNIHVRSMQKLMIEIFKTKENINRPFMREIFCERCF